MLAIQSLKQNSIMNKELTNFVFLILLQRMKIAA
jgi:hypothetical protein